MRCGRAACRATSSGDAPSEALEQAELAAIAHTPARLLSGGEQQRLALARALALAPEVLFLDEPTANLDPASTVAIERLVQDAHEDGTKIVLVTHDAGQARRLADEIVFLCDGRLEDHAPAAQFFDAPGVVPRARLPRGPNRHLRNRKREHPCPDIRILGRRRPAPWPSPARAQAADEHIIIQSTTSTEASGLFDHILPIFEEETGIDARVVAVGTGQALKNAQNCDGDVLFVHAKPDELSSSRTATASTART